MNMDHTLDLILVNPGGRDKVYQGLGTELTAIEPPLWCGLIATYIRDHGHSVAIIDSEAECWSPETVAKKIAEMNPRLVGMIVFGHQPSASTQMMVGAGESCRAIKDRMPDQDIIIVGGHISALPEQTLVEEAVDFVCTGEGPVTLDVLLCLLKKDLPDDDDDPLQDVPGIMYFHKDTTSENPIIRRTENPPLITDLDKELPGSAWDLLPMDKYRAHNWQCFGELETRMPYASIYTSLGCPYKCSFCCINAPFGKANYRMRSPEVVCAEIDHLVNTYGVKTYKFVDEMFVLNERHVMGVCNGLIERDYDLNIWAYARVDTVKKHMLENLRKAGFRWLALGIESGSEHVRDGSRKALKTDDIRGIVEMIQAAGIHVIGNYIFGLPDDTLESMQETLDLAKEVNCEFANFYSAMAYPGSPLHGMAIANGWRLPDSWGGYSQHSYECTPLPTETLSAAQVLKFRDQAFNEYFEDPRYIDSVTQRFGQETRRHIEDMARHKLRRQLLET